MRVQNIVSPMYILLVLNIAVIRLPENSQSFELTIPHYCQSDYQQYAGWTNLYVNVTYTSSC